LQASDASAAATHRPTFHLALNLFPGIPVNPTFLPTFNIVTQVFFLLTFCIFIHKSEPKWPISTHTLTTRLITVAMTVREFDT
jgi:hypothetical protein